MIYTSINGNQRVYAEQYTNKESIEKIKCLSPLIDILETDKGIVAYERKSDHIGDTEINSNIFVEPGQFVIMTTTGAIAIKDQPEFCERFVPATYQKELF